MAVSYWVYDHALGDVCGMEREAFWIVSELLRAQFRALPKDMFERVVEWLW